MNITVFGKCALPHSSQIYTGIHRLNCQRKLDVEYVAGQKASKHIDISGFDIDQLPGVLVSVNSKLVFFDLLDSCQIESEILVAVDFYLKRSYARTGYTSKKIIPLGLNFEIYNHYPYWFEIYRFLSLNYKQQKSFKSRLSVILDSVGIGFMPRIKNFEDSYTDDVGDNILFMARTWDPHEAGTNLSLAEQEDRYKINSERAELIKRLKSEFGKKFIGGFSQTSHSLKEFPNQVMPDNSLARKKNYLNLVKDVTICIATTGLHGSIGWKMAEYVALGRAIVSEKNEIFIPYGFEEEKNYLQFNSNSHCVEQIFRLTQDRSMKTLLMNNNTQYYKDYLMPEKIIENVITQITAIRN